MISYKEMFYVVYRFPEDLDPEFTSQFSYLADQQLALALQIASRRGSNTR